MTEALGASRLRTRFEALVPRHDSPIGLVHPYWARKPLNVIDTLIEVLTQPGDLIVEVRDPSALAGTGWDPVRDVPDQGSA